MGVAAEGARAASAELRLAHSQAVAGDIGILAFLLLIGSGGLAIADIWIPTALNGWLEWGAALAVIAVSALVFQFARLATIWQRHLLEKNKAPEAASLIELFAYLVLSHSALAAVVFLSTQPNALGLNDLNLSHTDRVAADLSQVLLVVGLFVLSFLPLFFAFFLQARQSVRLRNQRLLRDDVVSRMSLFIMLTLFGGIGLLAWAAAGRMFEMTSDFGVLVTGVVVIAFVATILAPHVARYWNDQSEKISARRFVKNSSFPSFAPEKWVSRADSVLVRLVAPLSGATQRHVPHFVLVAVMLPLSALGFVLASPFGLIPIALAMIIVLALGRRWAWLEDDRETASRLQTTNSDDIHIGFENDLKDEALLGYAWLFILVPLALNQLQEWTHSFRSVEGAGSGNAFVDWMRFFGAELAKAVPFVDWWEIYNVRVDTPFDAKDAAPLAKHLTFISRALVDLVIMAALFQALGIWQRSRTQQRLYDTGQLDYFDPFTEIAFFETGMQTGGTGGATPKPRFLKRVNEHVAARLALGRPPLPYNTHRLAELVKSDRPDVRVGAEWLIKEFGVLTGSPKEQLHQLRNRWLKFNLHAAANRNSDQDVEMIRHEKLEFERVLADLKPQAGSLSDEDIGVLYFLLDVVKGAPEFGYSRDLAFERLGQVASPLSVFVLAMSVLENRHHAARPDWRQRVSAVTGLAPSIFEGRADVRERAYNSLEQIGSSAEAELRTRKLALELLEWMAIPGQAQDGLTGDRGRSAAQAAKDAGAKVAASLGIPQ